VSKSVHCLKAYSPIIDLEVLENGTIIFATTNSGIRLVDQNDYSVLANILPQELDKHTLVAFSPDGKLVAMAKKNTIFIMVLRTQNIIKKIELEGENVDILIFDTSSQYVIVGTTQGRVYQYRFNSSALLSRLCSFPYYLIDEQPKKVENNFVSALVSYKTSIACSGYGGAIFVIDLHSREKKVIYRSRVRKIEALCFLDKHTLLSGNVDGVLEVIDLRHPKKVRRVNAPFTNIKHIIPMPNSEYVLVASDTHFIALIHIKTLKIIDHKYIEFDEKIKKMLKKDDDSLYVVLADSSVKNIELLNLSTLRHLIEKNKLAKAYRVLVKAPMLRGSKEEELLENRYQQTLQKIIKALLRDDKHKAKEIAKEIENIPSKKEEVHLVFEAFKHYKKLQLMFHQEKLHVAYSLCEKYPALKYTREYKSMEKAWQETFLRAQKEMLLNNKESARVLLGNYMSVTSKRVLIQFILYQNREFIQFLKAVEKREFKELNTLAKGYSSFSFMPQYQSLQQDLAKSVAEARELIMMGNTHLAQILIDKLEEDVQYEELVEVLQKESDSVEKLYELYEAKKELECYKYLDTHEFLKTTDLGIKLELYWHRLVDKGEKYALRGDIKGVEHLFKKFKKLPSRSEKVGDVFRVAYQKRMMIFLEHKKCQEVEKLLHTYTDTFGLDRELKKLIKQYAKVCKQKINLTEKQVRRKPRDYWLFC